MPVYEYKCKTCGKEFEYTQRITEEPLKRCPTEICDYAIKGAGTVERRISKNVGLVFKGSGFYLTDYVRKKNNFPHLEKKPIAAATETAGTAPKTETPTATTATTDK